MYLVTSQNRALEFGRFMLEKGASPIIGTNEGDEHEMYQEFYKHKTKINRNEFLNLKRIINRGNVSELERELENSVTVQCGEYRVPLSSTPPSVQHKSATPLQP